MQRKLLLLAAVCFFCNLSLTQQIPKAPKFSQTGSAVIAGNARFQFLTQSLVRMEFSPSGVFTDAPTAVVENRKWPDVKISAEERKGWLIAGVKNFTLKYRLNSGRFKKDNLKILWKERYAERSWAPGDSDKGNLGGIFYSLDGARKIRVPKLQPGILSRKGYFVLDDGNTPVWNQDSAWIVPRHGKDNQDIYLFIYGKEYARALKEYSELCGRIPMIPQYALGTWITDLNYEYLPGSELVDKYSYSDEDIKKIVNRFRSEDIPLDILVLDFAWHNFGWKGGYDWSRIFPKPKEFLDWAHGAGLKVSLNDHPGYGGESVLSDEDSRAPLVREQLKMPVPPKPTLSLDIARDWRFHTDPKDSGTVRRWFAADFSDTRWKTMHGGSPWEEQGFPDYDGFAWYRKWVDIPKVPEGGPLYIIFGGVDDEYDIYVNGEKAGHHGSPNNSVYSTVTFTGISSYVKYGEKNLIAVRVNDWGGGGGLASAPIMISDRPPAEGIRFNLADRRHAEVFMNLLHNPLIDQGADFWWIDGGRGSCEMEGLNSQMWTNRVYYNSTEEHTRKRAFIFSRYGGWGSHRYPGVFTGDTYSDWEVLAFEVPFTAAGGNVLNPYITHDIGGFLGKKIDFNLYARWLQFGVFSPLLRLHSEYENPKEGNLRMPWVYGQEGIEMARKYFRLRYSLLPYIYTYCRIAHDEALPLIRPLYLEYPGLEEAYNFPSEYLFGREFLVAPITDSTNERDVYLPPGIWTEYFTGKTYNGGQKLHERYPVDQIPLFVKAGAVIPMQGRSSFTGSKTLDTLLLEIYGGLPGEFKLYEDDGISLSYRSGEFAWTPIKFLKAARGEYQIVVGPTSGNFSAQAQKRAYQMKIFGLSQPHSIIVNGGELHPGSTLTAGWIWDNEKSVINLRLGETGIRDTLNLILK